MEEEDLATDVKICITDLQTKYTDSFNLTALIIILIPPIFLGKITSWLVGSVDNVLVKEIHESVVSCG